MRFCLTVRFISLILSLWSYKLFTVARSSDVQFLGCTRPAISNVHSLKEANRTSPGSAQDSTVSMPVYLRSFAAASSSWFQVVSKLSGPVPLQGLWIYNKPALPHGSSCFFLARNGERLADKMDERRLMRRQEAAGPGKSDVAGTQVRVTVNCWKSQLSTPTIAIRAHDTVARGRESLHGKTLAGEQR